MFMANCCFVSAQMLLDDAKNYTFMTHGGVRVAGRVATKILWWFWEGSLMDLLYVGNLYQSSTTLSMDPVSSIPTQTN